MDIFYLFLGIVIFVAGLIGVFSHYNYVKNGFHTRGTVVKNIGQWRASGGKFRYYYYPIIKFTTADDQELELKLEIGASLPLYSVGKQVKIIYYKEKIHPAGIGWEILYCLMTGVGLAILLYQIIFATAEL